VRASAAFALLFLQKGSREKKMGRRSEYYIFEKGEMGSPLNTRGAVSELISKSTGGIYVIRQEDFALFPEGVRRAFFRARSRNTRGRLLSRNWQALRKKEVWNNLPPHRKGELHSSCEGERALA